MKLIRYEQYNACTTQLCKIRTEVRFACQAMGYPETDINLIALAIDEACTNIIRFAYCGDKSGRIVLEVYQAESQAIFLLRDFAECIEESCLEVKSKCLTEPGGLGLQLINQIMDSVQLIPPPDSVGNILELKKRLPQG